MSNVAGITKKNAQKYIKAYTTGVVEKKVLDICADFCIEFVDYGYPVDLVRANLKTYYMFPCEATRENVIESLRFAIFMLNDKVAV